jgi:hypothetical protein
MVKRFQATVHPMATNFKTVVGDLGCNHHPRNFGGDNIHENIAMEMRKIIHCFAMYTSLLLTKVYTKCELETF